MAKARKGSTGWRLVRWTVLLGLLGLAGGAALVAGAFWLYGRDPNLSIDSLLTDSPKVVTRVVDRHDELLGEIFAERRTVVPREKIPPIMAHAIVDAEDAQFYAHKGLDYSGMLRALLRDVLHPGRRLQGGSTITQQLVKNHLVQRKLIRMGHRTLQDKVQEMLLARRLESQLSKDEILALYLNQIDFGHQRFGVEEAAQFYFGKSITSVDAGEAAILASLPKSPTGMDPFAHPERLKERQRYVLSQMVRYGHLTEADAQKIGEQPIRVKRAVSTVRMAPEFVDEAKRVLIKNFGEEKLQTLGLTVRTTCDARIQRIARDALERGLENLDERQGYRKPMAHWKGGTTAAIGKFLDERWLRRPHDQPRAAWLAERQRAAQQHRTVEVVVMKVEPTGLVVDTGTERFHMALSAKRDRYNPHGLPMDKRFSVGDVIAVRAEPSLGESDDGLAQVLPDFGPQAALVAIDPQTREVRALVGGYNFLSGGFDRARKAKRQPGSAFKPFLYAAAFNSGKYTPASVINDAPQVYAQVGLPDYAPKNAESREFLGPVRLRTALARSMNTVAAQLVNEIGPESAVEMARAAGIESRLEATLSLGLGAYEVSLFELTNAYATFAAGGRRGPPVLITHIGDEVQPKSPLQQSVVPEVAFLITSLLESVIEEGTAVSAQGKLHRPAAGKTGTTNDERDAWFIGYTPDLVVGVWVGFDDMRDLGHGEQGSRSALPIWIDVMTGALKGMAPRPFAQPPGIEVHRIDPTTGLLAPPDAPNAIDERFLAGTAPTQTAPAQGEQNPDTFIIDQTQ